MAKHFEIKAEKREQSGTAVCRRLRREDKRVPAIVYGGGQSPQPITLSHDEIIVALGYEAFYSNIVDLTIEGYQAQSVILKNVQRHPYKHKVLHVDFMRVKANEKLTIKIPLHFVGEEEAPGIKDQGGIVTHHANEIEVRCLPRHLPEFIEVDISNMQLDDILHLSDVLLPANVESVALALGEDHNAPVISIHIPHIVEEPAPEEAEATTAEGENEAETAEETQEKSSDETSAPDDRSKNKPSDKKH